jgi:hypothetical protein
MKTGFGQAGASAGAVAAIARMAEPFKGPVSLASSTQAWASADVSAAGALRAFASLKF